jgi:hypothetical protein
VDAARLLLDRRVAAGVVGTIASLVGCVALAAVGYALFA